MRAACFALAGLAIHGAIFYPGWLSFDSAYQLWQARHLHFNNLSPAPMTAWLAVLLRIFDTQSAAPLFFFHLILFWVGSALVLRPTFDRWSRVLLAIVAFAVATPLWWTLANVWTDSAVLAGYTAGVGLIVVSCNLSHVGRARFLHGFALVFLLYGSIARLNALPAAAPLFVLWWLTRPSGVPRVNVRAWIAMFALLCLSVGAGVALDRALSKERVRTWPVQVLHDLAGISVTTNTMYVPKFARDPKLTIETLRTAYTPYVAVPVLLTSPSLRSGIGVAPYTREESMALLRAWVSAIVNEPSAYMSHRLQMTGKLLLSPDRSNSYSIGSGSVAYRDNPAPPPFSGLSKMIVDNFDHLGWRFQFSFVLYLALFLATAYSLWHARRSDFVMTNALNYVGPALLASAALYVLPLFVFAPAADVRYLAWAVAAICFAAWSYWHRAERGRAAAKRSFC
jgi:hypothetical protein